MFLAAIGAALLGSCSALDGDTLRCGVEVVRLLGIDTPEMEGRCRQGRRCVPGDPVAAKASLGEAVRGRQLTIRRVGRDRFGRTLGVVWAGRVNLSCHQLRRGGAYYVAAYDKRQMIARCGRYQRWPA